jgi:hypothetical protein
MAAKNNKKNSKRGRNCGREGFVWKAVALARTAIGLARLIIDVFTDY